MPSSSSFEGNNLISKSSTTSLRSNDFKVAKNSVTPNKRNNSNDNNSTGQAEHRVKLKENDASAVTAKRARGWSFWGNYDSYKEGTQENSDNIIEPTTSDNNENSTREQGNNNEDNTISTNDYMDQSILSVSNHATSEDKVKNSQFDNKRSWSFWNRRPAIPILEENECTSNGSPLKNEASLNKSENKTGDNTAEVTINESNKKNDKLSATIESNIYIPYNSDAVLAKDATKLNTSINNVTKTNVVTEEGVEEENIEYIEQQRNILVPNLDILPHKSLWTSISGLFGHNSHPQKYLYRTDPTTNFYDMSNGEVRPIKILIVGVHGFFPTKMLRKFIGQPTGTSSRFIREAEEVIIDYFKEKNVDIEISKIALEKEGEIFERVDFFYEVMKKWAKDINKADFIYFATHSQGCPVTIILLSKLIETGILNADNTRFYKNPNAGMDFFFNKKIIAILGMAGINNGPFYGRDQTLLVKAYQTIAKDAMMELFEFQKYDSIQSKKLIQGLRIVIANNVKLIFIGSINDQLVPLYSSFCLFANHPNIFRATFIDKDSMTPSFITRMMKIAGTLINLGYDDHKIVKEISPSLVGPLTGGGHSTIYNEYQVYELGLKFALETTDTLSEVPVGYFPYKAQDLRANPYRLPWAMRSLVGETRKRLGEDEVTNLYKEYEEWRPETKQLKDIKYRLNGLKYQL